MTWKRLAEVVGEFVAKGSKVYVEGKLQTSSWEDGQSREKRYRTEIVADDLVLLGSRENGNGAQPNGSEQTEKPKATDPAVTRAPEISDEDLPF